MYTQLCPILCNPMDYSPPGSSVQGLLQARILEWIAMLSSRGSSQPRDWTQVSHAAGRFFTVWATREVWNEGAATKLSGIWWLNRNSNVLSHSWEAWCSKSRCWQGWFLLEAQGRVCFWPLPSFWRPPALFDSKTCRHITPISAFILTESLCILF